MYYVKKDRQKPNIYFILYKDFKKIDRSLTFSSFVRYLETKKIPFKKVKLINFSIQDLFTHFVDYESLNEKEQEKDKIIKSIGGRI